MTFTINDENEITAFASQEEATAATTTPFDTFAGRKQLAELATAWPAERPVAIWNSFAGVAGFGADLKPVQKFTDRKTAIKRIWTAIQKLAEAQEMEERRGAIRDTEAKLKAAQQRNADAPTMPETSEAATETAGTKAS